MSEKPTHGKEAPKRDSVHSGASRPDKQANRRDFGVNESHPVRPMTVTDTVKPPPEKKK